MQDSIFNFQKICMRYLGFSLRFEKLRNNINTFFNLVTTLQLILRQKCSLQANYM
jgi:hypothetical protein